MSDLLTRGSANISPCGRYRYVLGRYWSVPPAMTFIMLNPSIADALQDDPTIRRCMGFARREGCGGIHVVNLFAYRATKPADMFKADDPVGPLNDAMITSKGWPGEKIVAAWGSQSDRRVKERARAVIREFEERMVPLHCLGRTKDGSPRHPLYVHGDAPLIPFTVHATA